MFSKPFFKGSLSGFVELDLAYGTYIVEMQIFVKHCDGDTSVHVEQASKQSDLRF